MFDYQNCNYKLPIRLNIYTNNGCLIIKTVITNFQLD